MKKINILLLSILSLTALIAISVTLFLFPVLLIAKELDNLTTTIFLEPPTMVTTTAYTLRPEETDATPCQTALGVKVDICEWAKREQLCATGLYPLLTKLRVGDIECIVVDRPSPKNYNTIDIIMDNVSQAFQFGRKLLPVKVITN